MHSSQPLRILGTAQLCSPYGILRYSVGTTESDIRQFLIAAQALGFSTFDTAPSYEGAEEALGRYVPTASIHTKLDPAVRVEDSIRDSLHRLQRTHVEVAYLHDPLAPITDSGKAIIEAARFSGQYFDRLGTSVYSLDALSASLDRPEIQAIQIPSNPLWRDLVDALPSQAADRPLIFGRSLLAQGLLVSELKNLPKSVSHLKPFIQSFQKACNHLGRSTLECSLVWSRDSTGLDGHIIGATSITQLREIASGFDAPALTPDERAVIDAIPVPASAIFDPRTWK